MFTGDTFFSWRRATLIGMYLVAMLVTSNGFFSMAKQQRRDDIHCNEYATVVYQLCLLPRRMVKSYYGS